MAAAGPRLLANDEEVPEPISADDFDWLERRSVKVNGRAMHTLVSPDPGTGALPVVLVHGLALSSRYMLPTAVELASTHQVFLPDFPGFGESEKPARVLDVPALGDSLAAWMEAAGLEQAFLLGNSFACQIIAEVAARYPEKVAAAVLQGPTTPPDERTWFWQFVRWQQNSPYNPPTMGEIAGDDYRKTGLVRAIRTFQFSLDHRVEDVLPGIAAPSLVVRGALDPICNQEWAEKVARLLPQGRLVVLPDVSHTLVYTSAPELVAVSRPFFDEVARG
jgi:2-hydroxy-6-oxonona-2,4-dienedioate hydrolase